MNEALAVLHSRRSIRSYKPEQIADTELQEILNAALYAPNARNLQKWHFTVIQDKALLDRIVDTIKENILNSDNDFLRQRASAPGYHTFHHAPTVIWISADANSRSAQIDCGAAAENIALAAESLNIGSCLITSSALLLTSAKGNDLVKALGLPDGYMHICTVALGYKNGEQPAAPLRNRDVVNYIR